VTSLDVAACTGTLEDDGACLKLDTSLLGPVEWRMGCLVQLIGELNVAAEVLNKECVFYSSVA